jgi:hypothetical protein
VSAPREGRGPGEDGLIRDETTKAEVGEEEAREEEEEEEEVLVVLEEEEEEEEYEEAGEEEEEEEEEDSEDSEEEAADTHVRRAGTSTENRRNASREPGQRCPLGARMLANAHSTSDCSDGDPVCPSRSDWSASMAPGTPDTMRPKSLVDDEERGVYELAIAEFAK